VCAPGSTQSCYRGPPGSAGIGACKEGTETCLADGSAFGPCEGEIVPAAETCASLDDEDCDGSVNEEGAGCACLPSSVTSCYTGPGSTEGVGLCAPGTQTCSADGTSLGPCVGEILPAPESCQTAADENCSGPALEGCGEHLWSKAFPGMSSQEGSKVAVDGAGNVIVVGSLTGSADFGGGLLTANQSYDTFVAKFDPAGNHLWSVRMGGVEYEFATGVAVNAAGDVYVAGAYFTSTDLGGGLLTSAGQYDMFLVKLSGATGAHVFSKSFGGPSYDEASDIAIDAGGDVFVTGSFKSTINFGGGVLTATPGGYADIFVAKLNGSGNHVWSKSFGAAGIDNPEGLAVDPSGNVLVTGYFEQTVDFGGGPLASAGVEDLFILKLSSAGGGHVWSKRAGSASYERGVDIASDVSGNVLVTGYFAQTIDFGGGVLTSGANHDAFLVKLSPAGAHEWSKSFGDAVGYESGVAVVADSASNVILLGGFSESIDFGGGALTGEGSVDTYLAKFNAGGAHVWSHRYGSSDYDHAQDVAVGPMDTLLYTGGFIGTVDWGGGPLVGDADLDAFLVKLAP
jgi:hypothetical protein